MSEFDLGRDVFDLSQFNIPPRGEDLKLDTSGKPKPENVRVILNSRMEIQCDTKYDGLDPDGTRRYLVVAEIDWENYWPSVMLVGVYPSDVTLSFQMPDDMLDTEGWRRARSMQVVVEKQLDVPRFRNTGENRVGW